jgi:hypothetical protein
MAKMGRPVKWPQDTVDQIRYARFVEKRKIEWIALKFGVPIDTVRDYIYRGTRSGKE